MTEKESKEASQMKPTISPAQATPRSAARSMDQAAQPTRSAPIHAEKAAGTRMYVCK